MYKGHKLYYILLKAHARRKWSEKIVLERIILINMALYTAETSLLSLLNQHRKF